MHGATRQGRARRHGLGTARERVTGNDHRPPPASFLPH